MGRRRNRKKHSEAVETNIKEDSRKDDTSAKEEESCPTERNNRDYSEDNNEETSSEIFEKLVTLSKKLLLIVNYAFKQTESTVYVEAECLGIHNHPKELIRVEFEPLSLRVEVKDLNNKDCFLIVPNLSHEIIVEKSKFITEKDKIVLILRKAEFHEWDYIRYFHPTVIANFEKKLMDIINPLSQIVTFRDSDFVLKSREEVLKDVRFVAEKFSLVPFAKLLNGILKGLNVEQPSAVRNESELIEFLKSKINKRDATSFLCITFLAIVLLCKEKREFDEAYPETVKRNVKNECNNAKKRDPNLSEEKRKAEEMKENGNVCFKAKRFHEAIEAYSKAIALDPQCATYYLNRSVAYFHISNLNNSLNDAVKSIKINPFYAKGYLYVGKYCIAVSLTECALRFLFSNADMLDPNNEVIQSEIRKAETLRHYVHMFIDTFGNLLKRAAYLDAIRKVTLVRIEVYCKLIEELCRRNMFLEGKEAARNISKWEVDDRQECTFYLLGVCAFYEDDEDACHDNFKKCSNLTEEFYDVKLRWATMKEISALRKKGDEEFAVGHFEGAIECYLKGLELITVVIPIVSSKFFFKIANAKIKQNKKHEAVSRLNSAIDVRNDYHEAFALRGECHLNDGNRNEAVKDFEKAYGILPCNRYEQMLKRTRQNKKPPEPNIREQSLNGDEIDRREISLEKSLADYKKEKGNKYFTCKKYNDAIKAYSEAIRLDSYHPVYYSNRSACYMMLKNFEDALEDAKSALKIDPSFVKGLFRLGKCHIALGQPKQAIEALDKASKLKPNDESLKTELARGKSLQDVVNKGNLCLLNKDYINAECYFSSAVSLGEACVTLHLKNIDCLVHLGKFDEALSLAQSALDLSSKTSEIHYFMGLCFYHKGGREETLMHLEKSLSLDPNETKVSEAIERVKCVYGLKDLGNEAYSENRLEDALSNYCEGLRKDPSNKVLNAAFHFNIGLVHIKRVEWKEAVHSFTSAINLNKEYVKAYLKRAECYLKLNEFGKAVKDYEEVNKISPRPQHKKLLEEAEVKERNECVHSLSETELEIALAECKKEKGNTHFKEKRYEEASKCYSEALSLNPECPSYYANRSACHIMQNNYWDALNDAKEAVKIDSKYVKGYIRLGKCQNALGNTEEAIAAFEKARELDSNNEEVVQGVVKSLKLKKCLQEGNNAFIKKQFIRAAEQFKMASKIAFANASLLLKNAECLIRVQRKKEVSDLIESVPPKMKETPEVLCIKGMYSYHQDDKDEALKHLNKALELDPSNDETKELIKRIRIIYEKKEKGNESFSKDDLLDALNYFQEGLKVDPDNHLLQAKFHFNIGEVRMKRANFTDAILSFSNAIVLKEDYIKALERRAHCYEKTNELEKSIRDYQKLYGLTSSEDHLKLLQEAQRQLNWGSSKDYYKILRVSQGASMAEIRKSYMNLARQFHPDRMSTEADKVVGEERFKEINGAYSVLIDPLKRGRYDRGEKEEAEVFPGFFHGVHPFMFNPFFLNSFIHPIFREQQQQHFNPFRFGYAHEYDSD